MVKFLKIALNDLVHAKQKINIAFMLGWQDIRQRYRRSKLGPFWLTISMGIMIAMIGIVFGQVLNSPMEEYLPFLSAGIILWNCFALALMDGSNAFIESQGMIRQIDLPLSLYIVRIIWRNVIICAHNIIILPFVFLAVGWKISWDIFWIIPGFFVFLCNIFWISLTLSVLCTRFRDMPQIVNSLLQVFFYITPILWMPNALNPRSASLLVEPNPVYHLVQLVRAPLLGGVPTVQNWTVSILIACIGIIFSLYFFGKYKRRVAYWL